MSRVQIPFAVETKYTLTSAAGGLASGTVVTGPVSGASVSVTLRSDGTPATVYAAETGSGTLSGGALVTDANGNIPGWVTADVQYNITIGSIGVYGGAGPIGFDAVTGSLLTDPQVAPANKDGTASTPSLRTLGPGPQQAMPGILFGNGSTLSQRDTLYGNPPSPTLDTPFSSLNTSTTATGRQWAGGFYGVVSATGSTGSANNVGLYSFAREDRVAPTGGTWGLNAGATNTSTAPSNVQGAEIDINNMGTNSGSTASGAQPVHGLTVASGGTKRPLDAVEVVVAPSSAPFYYGIRFAEGSVYGSGAVVQNLTSTPGQIQWESFVYTTSYVNPMFRFNAIGKHEWGPGSAGVDTNLYRSTVATLKTDGILIAGAGVGAYGVTPPAVQPARAVTLADCVAVLAGAGLTS